MPQEINQNQSNSLFNSPVKNLRGLKGNLGYNCSSNEASYTEQMFNDRDLAQRKAQEAASRRYQAAEWLRQMYSGASELLPEEPTEEEFRCALRNGLILCNVLNKVNPGAVHKVVVNSVVDMSSECAAQSAIQYFENMRNFLVAVGKMQLLTFEASDLEKGGSSSKVVDCILCLKGYYEWKQAGGIGVWKYGGTVRITSCPKGSPSSFGSSDSADESLDDSESSQFDQLLEFLHLSGDVSLEESNAANILTFLFDRFGLGLLQAYLMERNGVEDFPLNLMVIDAVLRKVVKNFSGLLVSQSNQLRLFLKKILADECSPLSRSEVLEAISNYLRHRTSLVSSDCICGGKRESNWHNNGFTAANEEIVDVQQKELEELKIFCRDTKLDVQKYKSGWEDEFRRLVHHIKGLEVASSSYHKVLEENRMLFNQVQDLKGTIRVYCRVRPFLSGQPDMQSTVDYIGENGDIMIVNPRKQGKDARKIFTFNKVFGTKVTQQQIYVDTQPLVRSALDGFNVCIFAYGQTGSGKTYTMSGPDLTTDETWGVNYRALRDLFSTTNERRDMIEYEVGVQMIEIYNEQVRDLLVIDGANRRLDIRNNSQLNGLNVPDASLIPVKCTQDVLELMRIGQKNRAVGATALNERSSRSHSILTVHVRGKEIVSGSTLKGCLHLVDLAGSERVDKSEAVGERLKEAQHINRSLSALGDVISALAQKSSHIPYRNSKLTQVLQDSLGGQAKTLMFVHINPEADAFGETVSTLKFAERVASIDLGAARSNKETGEIRDMKEEISNLKQVLEKKEAELELLKSSANVRGQASPLRSMRHVGNASLKTEANQRPLDDSREVRSCSSGKQRRSQFPSKFTDKDFVPKMPLLTEEKSAVSAMRRSPSPPVRRSISTDRGAHVRSRIKPETHENPPVMKLPFPARAPVTINKPVTNMPSIVSSDKTRGCQSQSRQENISDVLYSLQKMSNRKIPEHDEEQFKQVLNVRQGAIRKSKNENKIKGKHQLSTKIQIKSDVSVTLLSDGGHGGMIDEAQRSDVSESENENGFVGSNISGTIRFGNGNLPRGFSRNSQNVEREISETVEAFLAGKYEDRPSSGNNMLRNAEVNNSFNPEFKKPEDKPSNANRIARNSKEVSNSLAPELKRSRSTPRGKYMFLP
ncbi:kinesin-like protein KIN-14F [Lycium barbarum]|uniref:kinesin-like protein KIN-14F n=1 Tax=Lycium barbarum TaxID=112863 RepID=UPI00293EAD84|nr:kinesin-like protein KIN-14F [Lycium barbarum]XP_060187486.1 kinesin-like protein KIN-14F [Lycium barbarum]XP_060187488.1 kinesin-like protein KIN-14F [Lycium barbarum]